MTHSFSFKRNFDYTVTIVAVRQQCVNLCNAKFTTQPKQPKQGTAPKIDATMQ